MCCALTSAEDSISNVFYKCVDMAKCEFLNARSQCERDVKCLHIT